MMYAKGETRGMVMDSAAAIIADMSLAVAEGKFYDSVELHLWFLYLMMPACFYCGQSLAHIITLEIEDSPSSNSKWQS